MKNMKKYIFACSLIIVLMLGIGIIVYKQGHKEESYDLENGIVVESVKSYTGAFVEDGSDRYVEDVWQLTVTNTGEKDIQYLRISADTAEDKGYFEITTLTAGSTVTVLERDAKTLPGTIDDWTFEIENLAYYTEERSLYPDIFQVSTADNWIQIKNTSQEDYTNDLYIYYKTMEDGVFVGGITYRTLFADGLQAGESKKIQTQHYEAGKSQILYLTYE